MLRLWEEIPGSAAKGVCQRTKARGITRQILVAQYVGDNPRVFRHLWPILLHFQPARRTVPWH